MHSDSAIAHHPLSNDQPDPKQQFSPPGQLPQVIYWAWHHIIWNIPLASLGQLCWLCSLLTSCAPPQSVEHGKIKVLALVHY